MQGNEFSEIRDMKHLPEYPKPSPGAYALYLAHQSSVLATEFFTLWLVQCLA